MGNLKVGDKVQLLQDIDGFKKGQVVELFKLYDDGQHLFKGANTYHLHCGGEAGAWWLLPRYYKVLHDTSAHPHADLMFKYAMIAQYDAKPWEQFEFSINGDTWSPCSYMPTLYPHIMYRLKPQPTVVQVGQTWVSLNNGQEAQVLRKPYPSEGGCGVIEKWVIGVVLDESINLVSSVVISELDLTNHFKLKK